MLVGGIFEGTLGLLAKYWRRIITPIVAAIVVTTIGYSLLGVGIRSFGGGYNEGYGAAGNLGIAAITLVSCLLFNVFAKGYWKQLSVRLLQEFKANVGIRYERQPTPDTPTEY